MNHIELYEINDRLWVCTVETDGETLRAMLIEYEDRTEDEDDDDYEIYLQQFDFFGPIY